RLSAPRSSLHLVLVTGPGGAAVEVLVRPWVSVDLVEEPALDAGTLLARLLHPGSPKVLGDKLHVLEAGVRARKKPARCHDEHHPRQRPRCRPRADCSVGPARRAGFRQSGPG